MWRRRLRSDQQRADDAANDAYFAQAREKLAVAERHGNVAQAQAAERHARELREAAERNARNTHDGRVDT